MNQSNQHSKRGVPVGALLLAATAGATLAWLARRGDHSGRGLRKPRSPAHADPAAGLTAASSASEALGDGLATVSEREIDEELVQTFPASDPLPHSHRVD